VEELYGLSYKLSERSKETYENSARIDSFRHRIESETS
jgi:hypothetical protein